MSTVSELWQSLLSPRSTLPVKTPLHVSLSRTFHLAHHQIEPFQSRLKETLRCFSRPFNLGIDLFRGHLLPSPPNKHFLGLPVTLGTQPLLDLLSHVDSLLLEFNQPTYHQKPLLHVSILELTHPPLSDIPLQLDGVESFGRFQVQEIRHITLKSGLTESSLEL